VHWLFVSAGKPLAVCHAAGDKGSAEASSANYEALPQSQANTLLPFFLSAGKPLAVCLFASDKGSAVLVVSAAKQH
jgi:hypothetical protein